MNDAPTFDPPYITTYETADGVRLVETLVDGTTRAGTPISVGNLQARVKQPKMAEVKSRLAKLPTATTPPPSPNVLPGDRAVLFLDVPFSEKNDAKRLGARWPTVMRKWYVPHGTDVNRFSRWWPEALKEEAKVLGQR